MGLFGDKPKGWKARSDKERIQTTNGFLDGVVAKAGITDVVVAHEPERQLVALRGKLEGFPLELELSNWSRINEVTLRYHSELEWICLEYDPELGSTTLPEDAEPQLVVAPGVYLEGDDAAKELLDFQQLSASLQRRVLDDMVRLRIKYFWSRRVDFIVSVHDEAVDVPENERWLATILKLAAEVSRARGAVPPQAV